MRCSFAIITVAVASFASAAFGQEAAPDWATSFAPDALKTTIGVQEQGLLVVGVGSDSAEATAALRSGLDRAAVAPMIMDQSALGDVASLDDPAIVAKAAHLPVARVVVVRVYPGSGGGPATAVVSVYQKEGAAVGGFAVKRGEVLAAMPAAVAASGARQSAMEAASNVGSTKQADRTAAIRSYESKYIGFNGLILIGAQGQMAGFSFPYQGRDQTSLEMQDFYNIVGRADLGDSYHTRLITRRSLIWGGWGAVVVGTVLALLPLKDLGKTDSEGNDVDPDFTLMYVGAGVAGVGFLAGMIGTFIDPNPVDSKQVVGLAKAYNRKLREDLGLGDDYRSGDNGEALSLHFGVSPLRDGAAGTIGGTFR